MSPINRAHAILKMFLSAHSGFNREDIQGYLNLLAFVSNPPVDLLEKVELIIKSAFDAPKKLRFRELFSGNSSILDDK